MENFESLVNKSTRTVIGALSGTSVDAVDLVLVRIKGKGKLTKIKISDFKSYPINKKLKEHILSLSSAGKIKTEDLCRLNFVIGNLFSECINKFIIRNNLTASKIDLIGSHGQTICHFPENKKLFGFDSKSTLQIGDPSVIAVRTGITVAGDFRIADVAAGGDGAPLVPYLDYILFSDKKKNRAFINIGGISNVTYLKKSCIKNEVIAFDTGPGNMVIDALMNSLFSKKMDKEGNIASKGHVNDKLFDDICSRDKYYKKKYPKSTGREYYGEEFVKFILGKSKNIDSKDIISTVTKYTAYTIYYNLKNFKTDEIIISGGGAKNKSLMNYLKVYFDGVNVKELNEKNITAGNKEAVLFAVLANELLNGISTNIRKVTGSKKDVLLGKICPA